MNLKYGIPILATAGLLGALFLMQMVRKPKGRRNKDLGTVSDQPVQSVALDYWLGDWDVQVQHPRREEELEEDELKAEEWARTVVEQLIGPWALVPGSTLEGVQSPLRSMVPQVENEFASGLRQEWEDGLGNVWKGKPCVGKEPMRLETTAKHANIEIVLYMFFKNDAQRAQAFDFGFAFAIKGQRTWKMISEIKFSRSQPLADADAEASE